MNSEVKEKWLRALRSGDYKQGKRSLKQNDTYCCLGVLCDLYQKEHPESTWSKYGFQTDKIEYSFFYLPRAVQRWSGLNERNPSVELDKGEILLSTKNDHGSSFEEIANIIEEYM